MRVAGGTARGAVRGGAQPVRWDVRCGASGSGIWSGGGPGVGPRQREVPRVGRKSGSESGDACLLMMSWEEWGPGPSARPGECRRRWSSRRTARSDRREFRCRFPRVSRPRNRANAIPARCKCYTRSQAAMGNVVQFYGVWTCHSRPARRGRNARPKRAGGPGPRLVRLIRRGRRGRSQLASGLHSRSSGGRVGRATDPARRPQRGSPPLFVRRHGPRSRGAGVSSDPCCHRYPRAAQ